MFVGSQRSEIGPIVCSYQLRNSITYLIRRFPTSLYKLPLVLCLFTMRSNTVVYSAIVTRRIQCNVQYIPAQDIHARQYVSFANNRMFKRHYLRETPAAVSREFRPIGRIFRSLPSVLPLLLTFSRAVRKTASPRIY